MNLWHTSGGEPASRYDADRSCDGVHCDDGDDDDDVYWGILDDCGCGEIVLLLLALPWLGGSDGGCRRRDVMVVWMVGV